MHSIGQAILGGCVVTFAMAGSNSAIIYTAVDPRGVIKSETSHVTWNAIFDKENAGLIRIRMG